MPSGTATAYFFAEHATNTGNTVLRVCAEQLGMTAADYGTNQMDVVALAQDFYFGGGNDELAPVTITPGDNHFGVTYPSVIDPGKKATMSVLNIGTQVVGDTRQLGVMLQTNADFGAGLRGGATQATEMILFTAPPAP